MTKDLKLVNMTTQDFASAKMQNYLRIDGKKWVKNITHYYVKVDC